MVRREHHVEIFAPQRDRLAQVVGPRVRVAHQRTPDGEDVVQRVRGVLRGAQRPELREVEVHLRRRLGAGRHLELDLHTVDGEALTRFGDVDGGGDETHGASGGGLPEAAADLAGGAPIERGAVHVARAARHRGAREHVLRDRVVQEALGRDHRHLARRDLLIGDDPLHPTEVVGVRVGVDHRLHWAFAAVLGVERERGGRGLRADERVDDDHASVALDHAHHREIEAAQLVDAGHHLEEAVLDQQLSLAPEARVGGVGRGSVAHELVGVEIPHDPPVGRGDLPRPGPAHEPAPGVVEVVGVVHRQVRGHRHDAAARRVGRLPRSLGHRVSCRLARIRGSRAI